MSNRISEMSEKPSGHRPSLVLIIDDDEAVRLVLDEVLRHHGYRVESAATAEEADTIKQRLGADAIGAVIVDIHLSANPRFREGYTLYEAWTALHPTLPFILISGISSSLDFPATRSGAVPFLAKPFTMEALIEYLRQLHLVSHIPPDTTI